jgi:hypothetical protein
MCSWRRGGARKDGKGHKSTDVQFLEKVLIVEVIDEFWKSSGVDEEIR